MASCLRRRRTHGVETRHFRLQHALQRLLPPWQSVRVEQSGGMHRYSQNHPRLHFGLGAATIELAVPATQSF